MLSPRVVLVQPQNPANVGFVARVLANFSLADWAIVGGPEMLQAEAVRTGAPAREVLDAARTVASLEEALEGATHTLGFTARTGRHRRPVPLPEIGALKEEWGPEARPALIFGREDRGLEAEEAEACTALATIPTLGLASLNLSHAVAIGLYEWFRDWPAPEKPVPPPHPSDPRAGARGASDPTAGARGVPEIRWSTAAERARLAAKALAELEAAGFEQHPEQLEATLRRLAAQPMEARDLRMLERIVRHARWLREPRE